LTFFKILIALCHVEANGSSMRKFTGKTATAIIPFPENKVLLIKRNTVPFVGYWALPGGRMDPGETVKQTIVRECKEETGLDVTVAYKVGEYIERGIKDYVEYAYFPTCFVIKVVGGKIKRQESEIQDIELFNIEALPLPLAFEHDKMIVDYLNLHENRLVKKN
jgi:8-oxo-dGTP diphosphatase